MMRKNASTAPQTLVKMKDAVQPELRMLPVVKTTEQYRRNSVQYPGFSPRRTDWFKKLKFGYYINIVHDYVEYGVERTMHEKLQIPNFGSAAYRLRWKSGMGLTQAAAVFFRDCRTHLFEGKVVVAKSAGFRRAVLLALQSEKRRWRSWRKAGRKLRCR